MLPPGSCPGMPERTLLGAGTLVLAVVSLPFGREQAGFARAGEAVRELRVGVRDCGAAAAVVTLVVAVTAPFAAVLARLVASRRRREAGEAGRRCARRERWLAPSGGRASLEAGAGSGAVAGRVMQAAMGDVQGLEGLGHLEDGSGQTGLLG